MSQSSTAKAQKAMGAKSQRKGRLHSKKESERKIPQAPRVAKTQKPVARDASKLASVIAMLRRPKGASIQDLCKVTGWQTHSVRGAISGAIKKRLGLTVTSEKSDGVRIYRVIG